ncbi:hypothetical protein RB601_002041 [Gaeumannomyces tritici]
MAAIYNPMYHANNTGFYAAAGQRQQPVYSPIHITGECSQAPADRLTSGGYAPGYYYTSRGSNGVPPHRRYNQHFHSRYGGSRFPNLAPTFPSPPQHMLSPSPSPQAAATAAAPARPSAPPAAYSTSPAAGLGMPSGSQQSGTTPAAAAAAAATTTIKEDSAKADVAAATTAAAEPAVPHTIRSFIQDAMTKAGAVVARAEEPGVAVFINSQPGRASRVIEKMAALTGAAARVPALLAELEAGRQESYELLWPAVGRVVGLVAEAEAALDEMDELVRAWLRQELLLRSLDRSGSGTGTGGYYPVEHRQTGRYAFVRGRIDRTQRALDPRQFPSCLPFRPQ